MCDENQIPAAGKVADADAEPPVTVIRRIAGDRPDAVALLPVDDTIPMLTYADLMAWIDTTAAMLVGAGVGGNDRIATVAPAGIDAAVAFLAASTAGIAAPLNQAGTEEEFARSYRLLKPRVVLAAAGAPGAALTMAAEQGVPVVRMPAVAARAVAAAADPSAGRVALLLATSGTTGPSKLVPLTHANLGASARNVRRSLELTADDRCLNVMPLFHIHGLVAALLGSLTAGGSVACAPVFDAAKFPGWLTLADPTWFTAVPAIHQAVLRAAATGTRTSRMRFIRSSSAALPLTVWAGLERHFGVPVIEAYGMSEAAHQIASNPLPPGRRIPGSVGPATGQEVAVLGADGEKLPAGARGEVVIRGANVTSGYSEPAEANAAAFVDGWFRTGDQGFLDADGHVYLTGRIKELINRGGEKISPREVEEALLAHPGISEAVVFGVPHPAFGEDVGVAIVPAPGSGLSITDVRAHARGRLSYFKIPRHIVLVPEVPKGSTGKVQRAALAARLGLSGSPGAPGSCRREGDARAPATPLETELVAEVMAVLGEAVGVDDDFIGAGCDSIQATRIVARIRDRCAVDLGMPEFFRLGTVGQVALAVTKLQAERYATADIDGILADLDSRPEAD